MPETRFVYVTRLPPSPSGVALYARDFHSVLLLLGPVQTVALPGSPHDSQRVSTLLATVRQVTAALHRHPDAVVMVELAGRGLAEFWTALAVRAVRPRTRLWLTVHDAPAVTGGPFFLSPLDRKGGRRVAAALSRTAGHTAERRLLASADRVFCLSAGGAQAVRDRYELTRSVNRLPHVAIARRAIKQRIVFVAGYLDGAENVLPVLQALAGAPKGWTVEVGACGPQTENDIRRAANTLGVGQRVSLLGHVDEEQLAQAYARAAIVVRFRLDGWQHPDGSQRWAVSGPLLHAMAHGCAIVTNDSRGTRECLDDSKAVRVATGHPGADELTTALRNLMNNPGRTGRLGNCALEHVRAEHEPPVLAAMLKGLP